MHFITVFAAFSIAYAADIKAGKSAAEVPKASTPPTLAAASARRNENVAVNLIDKDVLKEANIRLGVNYSILPQPLVEMNYYTAEHGRPPSELGVLRTPRPFTGFHGDLFEDHRNSVFNARTFFQSGPVKPSRQNSYGARFSADLGWIGALTGSFSQRKIRGMVNGNVLVPLANERTPTATDPAVRAMIQRFLNAYPAELPNRQDFDERALNTNAPQRIDELDGALRLDHRISDQAKLFLSHALGRQRVSAFQLVAGQNPDMEIHNQRSRLTFQYSPAPSTDLSFGIGFTRVRSLLKPEPNAVGPRVRMGFQIEELGPDSHFPIDRAQNTFRWGFVGAHRLDGGRHALTFGGDVSRFQLNGSESNDSRGMIWFTSNFGRTAIQNFLNGASTTYEVMVGDLHRGFRNWNGNAFIGDQWRVSSRLQIYYGLRYNMETTPQEVNRRNLLPYSCDCNNLSPRFHIALQLPRQWVLRTGYTTSFDQIPPVAYQQIRYNPPLVFSLQVQSPNLLNPLQSINLNDPNTRTSRTFFSPELVAPYAHQYSLSLERKLGPATWRTGYVGSRSIKLMNVYIENRAEPIPGIPLTTATVDLRRADQRYYDVKNVVNGGVAYLDAGMLGVDLPRWHGAGLGVTYTFSKAIDEGPDFTATAANRDLSRGRAQSQYESLKDRKGLSNFDATHALLIFQNWDLPKLATVNGWLKSIAGGWQWSSSALLKSGTPLTLFVGSDAPGFGNVDGGPSERPNILDPSILGLTIGHPDTAPQILRRDRFGFIVPGERRGNLGKGTFRKAGIANWNGAMTKRWRLPGAAERLVQFRAESFNLGNHPQFDEPNRNLNASAFGKITNTLNDGRIFQLGLRFIL
ncbi:MAG TPA: TonB-dependent receptor [Bryobacteraceae bacterium]|nr:TonB-dependent receptor [Bryobacteraceae bacterium]